MNPDLLNNGGALRLRGNVIEISFPYNALMVQEVKDLPGRRWNPDGKIWTVPATSMHAPAVITFAQRHDLAYGDEIAELAQRVDGSTLEAIPVRAPADGHASQSTPGKPPARGRPSAPCWPAPWRPHPARRRQSSPG